MKIRYSPSARDKLRQIKLASGTKITETIVKGINGLLNNPRRCPKIENMLGIPSPYRFLQSMNLACFPMFSNKTFRCYEFISNSALHPMLMFRKGEK